MEKGRFSPQKRKFFLHVESICWKRVKIGLFKIEK
jgi:hypothetical protein